MIVAVFTNQNTDMYINPKMDMQKIVTLDGFGVRADPREHFVKTNYRTVLWSVPKVPQMFEVVRGLHGPCISILGLNHVTKPHIGQAFYKSAKLVESL